METYIKEIRLQNFKTFRKAVIPFHRGFTAITGPNGSGKSNLIDAIVFCLGVAPSSKVLRAKQLTDLIHSRDGGQKANFAEVSISFQTPDGELEITRRVRETSPTKYYSTYYMNGRPCTLSEIHETLEKYNIPPTGSNIVMQDMVKQVVHMSPTERRILIDEVAGVAEFDDRKEAALRELEAVNERIKDVNVYLKVYQDELASLERDVEHAKEYSKLLEEKRRCELGLKVLRFRSLKDELERSRAEISNAENEIGRLEQRRKECEEMRTKLEDEIRKIDEEMRKRGAEEASRIRKDIERLALEIGKLESDFEKLESLKRELEREREDLLVRLSSLEERMEELRKRERDELISRDAVKAEMDGKIRELEEVRGKLHGRVDIKDRMKRAEELKGRMDQLRAEIGEIQTQIDRLWDACRRKGIDVEELERKRDALLKRVKELEGEREKRRKDLDGKLEELRRIERDEAEYSTQYTKVLAEIEKTRGELERAVEASRRMESPSVRAVMDAASRGELSGICGTISDLMEVDPQYAVAVEVAAGPRLKCVVTETDEDAAHAIQMLKDRKLGRVTFLPLNRLVTGKLPPAPRKKGIIDYAVNLVKFDERYRKAFLYVFGDTLVVDTLDTARNYINHYRMVTLDGELIEQAGAITGGSVEKSQIGAVKAKIQEMESKLEELRKKEMILDEGIRACKRRKSELNAEIHGIELELSKIEEDIEGAKIDVERVNSTLTEIGGEEEDATKKLQELEGLREKKQEEMKRCEDELKEIEKELVSAKDLASRVQELESQLRNDAMTIKHIEVVIDEIRREIEGVQNDIKRLESQRDEISERIGKIPQEAKKIRDRIGELNGEIEKLRVKEEQIGKRTIDLSNERDAKLKEMLRAERERDECDRRISELRREISKLKCRIDEISPEVEMLGAEVGNEDIPEISYEELRSRLNEIDEKLGSMGPVNMRALQEYEEKSRKVEEMAERRRKLRKEMNEIIRRIEECEKMKKDAFMRAFNEVNENFKRIYHELTDGSGELVLENPEDPFSGGLIIRARPSGKGMRGVEARSGGEQSVIALSLLLAIQECKPAPFYAMDEIDEDLDAFNTERAAKMIKRCSSNSQFIVVSLREPMVMEADRIVGVCMEESDISTVTGVELNAGN